MPIKILKITAIVILFAVFAPLFYLVLYHLNIGTLDEYLYDEMYKGLDFAIDYYDTNEEMILSTGQDIIERIIGFFSGIFS